MSSEKKQLDLLSIPTGPRAAAPAAASRENICLAVDGAASPSLVAQESEADRAGSDARLEAPPKPGRRDEEPEDAAEEASGAGADDEADGAERADDADDGGEGDGLDGDAGEAGHGDSTGALERAEGRIDGDGALGHDDTSVHAEASRTGSASGPMSPAVTPRQAMSIGCVLGGAIGDAMGHPTEFLSMSEIRRRYGAAGVTGFELYWDRGGARFAPYTDDTQMAEVVLRALLESRDACEDLDAAMRRMAAGFVEWASHPQGGHRAPGNACLSGCRALSRGVHWSEAGGETAGGCGSVMRAYPFGLVFADDLRRCEAWAVAHSKLTHRDPIALAASAAMAIGVARVVRGDRNDVVLSEMVAAACRHSPKTARMMAQSIEEALDGVGPEVTLDRNRGWAAHEAIAAAVYVLARHPTDAHAAILEGANTPGDSDSIATLAGSLVGARVGLQGLPAAWVRDVERADALTALARAI